MKQSLEFGLKEIIVLDSQLNGIFNHKGVKIVIGILDEELGIKAKYWLDHINEKVSKEMKRLNKFKNELIKKHGERIGKSEDYKIESKIRKKVKGKEEEIDNPKWEIYSKELEEFLDEKTTIEFTPVNIDLLDGLKTKNNYSLVYKFFKVEQEEVE